jgi:hypothetical protein
MRLKLCCYLRFGSCPVFVIQSLLSKTCVTFPFGATFHNPVREVTQIFFLIFFAASTSFALGLSDDTDGWVWFTPKSSG